VLILKELHLGEILVLTLKELHPGKILVITLGPSLR
jgi:hypothetical protein